MLPAIEKPSPSMCPHQSTQSRPVWAAMRPLRVHDVKLAGLAAGVRRDQGVDDLARRASLAQQL